MDRAWHRREWLEWLLRLLEALGPPPRSERWLEDGTGSFLGAAGRGDWDDRSAWVGAESSLESPACSPRPRLRGRGVGGEGQCPPTFSYSYGNAGERPSPTSFTYVAGALLETRSTTASLGSCEATGVCFEGTFLDSWRSSLDRP